MDEVRQVVEGDGYAAGHIDEMGDRYGFRKVRRSLGVTAFGVNVVVFPPGVSGGTHWHDEQEEVYFGHRGVAQFEFGDGSKVQLGPGGTVRVDAPTHRRISNPGDEDLVVFVVGGKEGYVGRDGHAPEGEERVRPS